MNALWTPLSALSVSAGAAPAVPDALGAQVQALAAQVEAQQANTNHVWTMVAAGLVLLMQAGFLLLEAGMTRSKNSISVAQKNVADFFVSVTIFFVIGFGLMFGPSIGGALGAPWTLIGLVGVDAWTYTFFVFQAAFVGTAATIVSGAVAERMTFSAYLWSAALIALLIYPVFGHWVWGGLLDSDNQAWLANLGFIDFAGSTVVHSIGGWVALAGLTVLGARRDRFGPDGKPVALQGHSIVLSAAGAMLLLVGWIGFNGGSTLAGTPEFGVIVANTVVAATSGGCAGMLAGRRIDGCWRPARSINGMLAGLVGVTAGCATIEPAAAMAIGAICGCVVGFSEEVLLHRFKLDDVVGAVSVHGVCGAIGTILLAAFAPAEALPAGGRFEQFGVQALGVCVAFAWAFPIGFAAFKLIDATVGLRVPAEDEQHGLNAAEHGATLGTGLAQDTLHRALHVEKDLTIRLDESGGDEAADLARVVNPFLDRVQALVGTLSAEAGAIAEASDRLAVVARRTVDNAQALEVGMETLATASGRLDAGAHESAKIAAETAYMTSSVGSLAADLQSVSAVIQDLSHSVESAAASSRSAASLSDRAGALARSASQTVRSLADASQHVEDVVRFIETVAAQTNLLSLNATIEASRAGAAGRGFAVVAAEVKQLAEQTQRAASTIKSRLGAIRADARRATQDMDSVFEIIDAVDDAMRDMQARTDAHQQQALASRQDTSATIALVQHLSETAGLIGESTAGVRRFAESVIENATTTRAVVDTLSDPIHKSVEDARALSETAESLRSMSQRLQAFAGGFRST